MSAHSDWINTLETDTERRMMYSGCKDGIVKVWKLRNRQLRCSAQLSLPTGTPAIAGSNSINTISKIDRQFGVMFATGGSDRQIRIWKQKVQTEEEEEPDGTPDYEMVDEAENNNNNDDMFEFDEPSSNKSALLEAPPAKK